MALNDGKLDELRTSVEASSEPNVKINGADLVALLDDLVAERSSVERITVQVATLAKEVDQLRNQIAGNARALPEPATLEDQRGALHDALAKVRELLVARRLTGLVIMWEAGRAIVVHAKADPVPLIVTGPAH